MAKIAKRYMVYLSDHPYDPMICTASTATEARHAGQRYIKRWKLSAMVLRVEECPDGDDDSEWIPEF